MQNEQTASGLSLSKGSVQIMTNFSGCCQHSSVASPGGDNARSRGRAMWKKDQDLFAKAWSIRLAHMPGNDDT